MAYQYLITRLIRALEKDTVITNPKDRGRVFLRKLAFRSASVIDKMQRWLRGRNKRR